MNFSFMRQIGPLVLFTVSLNYGAQGKNEKENAAAKSSEPAAGAAAVSPWPSIARAKPDSGLEKKIAGIMATLTLERKIGQMIQIEVQNFTPELMKKYRFGSVLNGGGSWPHGNKHASIADWVALADAVWKACTEGLAKPVPPLWGTDAVHGHNNIGYATLFPHNIGLGAAHDSGLIRRIARATAAEVAATGLDWNFSPVLAVCRDDRWGRSYESFSENPAVVSMYAAAYVSGLQGAFGDLNVLATAKHFLADGGTANGIDRGDFTGTEEELVRLHAPGYFSAIKAGVQTVMVSYSSWRGKRMHENQYLLTEILKKRLGFDGFVISDYNAIGMIPGCSNQSCPQAVNAGIDMFMIPSKQDCEAFAANLKSQVETGGVSMTRIDDAVSRILRVKFRSGLFDKPSPKQRPAAGKAAIVGSAEHRAIAREAVRKSLVLLKNDKKILPLSRSVRLLVAGFSADSIAMQTGGWSVSWQGGRENSNKDFHGATSLYSGIKSIVKNAAYDPAGKGADSKKYDAAIVVIGEKPYAEYKGDIKGGLTLEHASNRPEDLAVIQTIKNAGIPVVTVFLSGRPLCVNKELNLSDAFVAAWLPGSEGAGIADVLFRSGDGTANLDFTGKLPFSWPKEPCQTALNFDEGPYDPLFPIGYGLTYKNDNGTWKKIPETDWKRYGCADSGAAFEKASGVVTIFNGQFDTTKTPHIGGESNWAGTSGAAGSSMPEISVETADDKAGQKGKALRLSITGPSYWIVGGKEQDLSGYYLSNYSLVFYVKVLRRPAASVRIVTTCHYPCGDEVDITEQLSAMSPGTWQEIRIPLKEFKGTNFRKIDGIFELSSDGAADLVLSDIRWE